MRPNQFGGHAVTEARRHLRRAHDIGEHDRPVSGVHNVMRLAGGRLRVLDPAEKGFHRGKRNFDNLARNMAVRLTMHALGGILVGRIHEAEGGAPLVVKPVSEEFYPILILDFEVLAMRVSDVGGCYPVHIVTVHEDRHCALLSTTSSVILHHSAPMLYLHAEGDGSSPSWLSFTVGPYILNEVEIAHRQIVDLQ